MSCSARCRRVGLSLLLAGALGAAHAVDSPEPTGAPAEVVKPVVPSKAELADSAFKKLDPTGKGYVTLEDTKGLDGFDNVFRVADTDHSGKLDFEQFKKAWTQYSGYKQ